MVFFVKKISSKKSAYGGFEQGPIRPPSEASSLLLRLTRNCPWNRCTFCPVYRDALFSPRPVAHVLQDIEQISRHINTFTEYVETRGPLNYRDLDRLSAALSGSEQLAFYAAYSWFEAGMESIFLQDADSLVLKSGDLLSVLEKLRNVFPQVRWITAYARSRTIDRITAEHLRAVGEAGLNRIHIGLESGSDKVLQQVCKGADQAMHIRAGLKVKQAGIGLSEYVMPGLGGKALSDEHAIETANTLNHINPDFIRLRTLAIPHGTPLYTAWEQGLFVKLTDVEVAEEIGLFLDHLDQVTSTLQSDHILNLLQEVAGTLPQDRHRMKHSVTRFLKLSREERLYYQIGRRLGIYASLDELNEHEKRARVTAAMSFYGINMENVDEVIDQLMRRFI